MIKKLLQFTLTLGIAFFVSELPPIAELTDPIFQFSEMTIADASKVKERLEADTKEILREATEKNSEAPLKRPEAITCETLPLSGGVNIECVTISIDKDQLHKDQSYSDEANVILWGLGGGASDHSPFFGALQYAFGIYQPLIGPVFPGYTNEQFGKTSTEICNYREIKDLFSELFLKLKEKYGKIQLIGFSHGGMMAILGYLSLKKEDREGIRVIVGDPGVITLKDNVFTRWLGWLGWFVKELDCMIAPRYDGSWYDFCTFPLNLFERLIMWIVREVFGFCEYYKAMHDRNLYWWQKQLEEMLAKEPDGSLDIQITGCGKKASDMSDEEIIDLIKLTNFDDSEEVSPRTLEAKQEIKDGSHEGACTNDGVRKIYERWAQKTKYPLTTFDCLHSYQPWSSANFWKTLKDRMMTEDNKKGS